MDYKLMTSPCGLDCFHCDMFVSKGKEDIRNKKILFFFLVPILNTIALFSSKQARRLKVLKKMLKTPKDRPFCRGCRNEEGIIPLLSKENPCLIYQCTKSKNLHNCSECPDFPCPLIYPKKKMADILPHNIKLTNCCLIQKHGLKKWAEEYSGKVKKDYFTGDLPFQV